MRDRLVAALNKNDKFESCSIDKDGNLFDALHGEYGAVILSKEQLDNLVELMSPQ